MFSTSRGTLIVNLKTGVVHVAKSDGYSNRTACRPIQGLYKADTIRIPTVRSRAIFVLPRTTPRLVMCNSCRCTLGAKTRQYLSRLLYQINIHFASVREPAPVKMPKLEPSKVPELEEPAFWLVWRDGTIARRKHRSLESAEKEAARLARKHPGIRFVVLKAVSDYGVEPAAVQRRQYHHG